MIVQHTYLITLKNKNWTQIKNKTKLYNQFLFFQSPGKRIVKKQKTKT